MNLSSTFCSTDLITTDMEANEVVVTECESRKKGVKEKKHSLGRNKESNAG